MHRAHGKGLRPRVQGEQERQPGCVTAACGRALGPCCPSTHGTLPTVARGFRDHPELHVSRFPVYPPDAYASYGLLFPVFPGGQEFAFLAGVFVGTVLSITCLVGHEDEGHNVTPTPVSELRLLTCVCGLMPQRPYQRFL